MKRIFFSLLFAAVLFSQTFDKSEIANSDQYYYGEGISIVADEARDKALAELTSQIAVRVSSTFKEKLSESNRELQEKTEKVLETYSAATLNNVNIQKFPAGNRQVGVFCYLKKSEVEKIFNERRKLISEIFAKAEQFEKEYNFAYALKLYYFTTILMNSLPDQQVKYNNVNYSVEVPDKINGIILRTKFQYIDERMASDKEREVTLQLTNKNHEISLLDFTFWDGKNQVAVTARDGIATVSLLGSSVTFDELKLNIKYQYYECRDEYKTISELWNLVNKPTFKSDCLVPLKLTQKSKQATEQSSYTHAKDFNLNLVCEDPLNVGEAITQSTIRFLSNLEANTTDYDNDEFLKIKIRDYMGYNHPSVTHKNIEARINKTETGWELRRIPVLHKYPSMNRQSLEFLVLDFDSAGVLQDFNIAVNEFLYEKFAKAGEYGSDWHNRHEIIKFLEKYRTAYMVRDIRTVDMMFAEDALIIVGRKIEKTKLPPDMVRYNKLGKEPDYEYLRFTKEEYLKRQQQIFELQNDILLDFASFSINRKNKTPNIYGVEMRQNYFSTTYSDEGYLFLLIDFSDVDPLIYVRAWQPNTWSEDELIRTANFRIYK
ncbi:MAG: LPP20 family lipoprotein [Candidatus Marinimicrobia bacterium]|nr:LPP20 family lipoprotein [Candidatus Neomarinimicrobiota bacterium]